MKKKQILAIIILAIVSVVALVYANLTPKESTYSPVQGSSCSFVKDDYIGLSEAQATEKARLDNRVLRIASKDGVPNALTDDFNPNRVNIHLNGDHVELATCS